MLLTKMWINFFRTPFSRTSERLHRLRKYLNFLYNQHQANTIKKLYKI